MKNKVIGIQARERRTENIENLTDLMRKDDPQLVTKLFENRVACEWLSTKEAAHYLKLSEGALRIRVHRDQIPAFKFGRQLRFRTEDLLALFQKKGA